MDQVDVIEFIKEQTMHKFGILELITIDQGTMFTINEARTFTKDYDIKILTSVPHYAQVNG